MQRIVTCLLVTNFLFLLTSASLQTSQASELGYAVFIYPKDVYSERDLSECPENTACSILYRRYWFPSLVERHCRCSTSRECDWNWSQNDDDNHTLALDSRTQLKFCTKVKSMENCSSTSIALKLDSDLLHHTTNKPRLVRNRSNRVSDTRSITALCNCPSYHRWEPERDSETKFKCVQINACEESGICGYIRTDLFSASYQCSCPIGQQCVTQHKQTHYRNLLLYSGPVYTAYCSRVVDRRNTTSNIY